MTTTTPAPTPTTVQFGNIVTEHELLSRTIPHLFSSVRTPTLLTTHTPAPTWHRAPTPAPRRGGPRLTLGSISVARNEWCVGNTATSLRDWHAPLVAPPTVVSFARVLRRAKKGGLPARGGDLAPRGLQNVSNDCFANSVLQVLVHCAPLRDWFERLAASCAELEAKKRAAVAVPPLVRVFMQLLHDYRHGIGQDDPNVSPWSPFAAPLPALKLASRLVPTVMPGRKTVLEQQDAQEFLFLLLDSIHASLLDAGAAVKDDPAKSVYYASDSDDDDDGSSTTSNNNNSGTANGAAGDASSSSSGKANGGGDGWTEIGPASRKSVVITAEKTWRDSPVSQLLRGRLRSTLKRRNANSSISIEPFFALSLEPLAGGAVAAALPDKRRPGAQAQHVALSQLLKAFLEPERVTTLSHNTTVAREKQTSLEQLPPHLLIHIARFAFVNGATRKLDTHVEFGTELDVPVDLFALHTAPPAPLRYRLRGVVRHHGATATSGHYTACVLVHKPATKAAPAGTDEWYLCDDTRVSPIAESAVLASTDTAYLLMFERV